MASEMCCLMDASLKITHMVLSIGMSESSMEAFCSMDCKKYMLLTLAVDQDGLCIHRTFQLTELISFTSYNYKLFRKRNKISIEVTGITHLSFPNLNIIH